jgi:hypothetical protein
VSEGRLYCALPNAFLCRKELAAGRTSNGNDLVGLAFIKPNEGKTLRSGDMIARETILEVVKCVDEGPTKSRTSMRSVGFRGEELSFHLRIFWAANLGCWEDHMEQAIRQATQADLVEPSVPGISWAAVLAGAVASLALTLVLISFGAGMGFSVVSPWGNSGVSASTFKIGTGLYFIVMAMISSAIGGYLAGRLRTKWVGVQTTEVHFRDTAHGFLAWAAASVLGAVLLTSPASSLIGGTLSGATQAAANSAQSSPMDGYVDRLLRSDNPSAQGQQNPSDARGEMVRLFTSSFHNGNDLNPADRTYVAKVVAARTGLSQADAEKRVNDAVTQVKADLDAARKAAMQIAIWLTLSLFIGAFSASLAATEGGGLRDGTWDKKVYGTPAINR